MEIDIAVNWEDLKKITTNPWVFTSIILVFPISSGIYLLWGCHEPLKILLDNLLNGGLSIIPATLIVGWQVYTENKSKVNDIERQKRDRLKFSIFSLLVFINTFPQLFEPKLRTSSLEKANKDNNFDYRRVINLKSNIQTFRTEFIIKSNDLQTQLIYLENTEKYQEVVTKIIKCCTDIEFNLQKLISILNKEDLAGWLGYSERDYEKVITKMYELKNLFCELPDYLHINKEFMESHLASLEYWHYIIEVVKDHIEYNYDSKEIVTVSTIRDLIDSNISKNLKEKYEANQINNKNKDVLNDALRDCLKTLALKKDMGKTKSYYSKDSQYLTIEFKKR